MKKRTNAKRIAYFSIILILVLVMLYSGLQILESTVFYRNQDAGVVRPKKTLTVDGVDYFPRQDITVMMVLGIDQYGPVEDSGSYMNTGASDVVMLLVFDEKNEKIDVLYLNRDTMLEMPVLGLGGKKAGTMFGQLALSHTYGSGLADSCENTREAVSTFLHGIHIDYYLAMNMDAIQIMNDAVGGVTVTVTEDFSDIDPTITMGQITLRGEQAITYVRTRKDVGDQLNLSRMERQKGYIDGFLEAMRAKLEEGEEFILTTYDAVAPYLVSDCSMNTISNMMQKYEGYEIREIVSPEGENVMGETYFEFYADEDALTELVLRMFYAPK